MWLLSVLPITRGIAPDALSYYSKEQVPRGALVTVSVRRRKVPALVLDAQDARHAKTEIKRSSFALKKIDGVLSPQFISPLLLRVADRLAEYYVSSVGAVLSDLIPPSLFKGKQIPLTPHLHHKKRDATGAGFPVPKVLQLPYQERVLRYKSIIREAFAHNISVVVVTPTRIEAEDLAEELSRGIEERVFTLTSLTSVGQFKKQWKKAEESREPIMCIGTGNILTLTRPDIGIYIVEHESSPHYKSMHRPFLDVRQVSKMFGEEGGRDVVWGDDFLRVPTLIEHKDHLAEGIVRSHVRTEPSADIKIIDMRRRDTDTTLLPIISEEGLALLTDAHLRGDRSFVYTVRKGFAPFTLCRDCGEVLSCERCDAPMVLYLSHTNKGREDRERRIFACNRCGAVRDAKTLCGTCGSWRLEMYGVGAERVVETLAEHIPKENIFLLTAENASTEKKAKDVISRWKNTHGSILVGTAAALSYLRREIIAESVIASLETLTALPDIGMNERIFRLVSYLKSITAKRLLVQTRNPDLPPLLNAKEGDGQALFRLESAERERFSYPPFSQFIKVTHVGEKGRVLKDLQALKDALPVGTASLYPAFISRVKKNFIAHLLISLPPETWPHPKLAMLLKSLSPAYTVNVDPESIL